MLSPLLFSGVNSWSLAHRCSVFLAAKWQGSCLYALPGLLLSDLKVVSSVIFWAQRTLMAVSWETAWMGMGQHSLLSFCQVSSFKELAFRISHKKAGEEKKIKITTTIRAENNPPALTAMKLLILLCNFGSSSWSWKVTPALLDCWYHLLFMLLFCLEASASGWSSFVLNIA